MKVGLLYFRRSPSPLLAQLAADRGKKGGKRQIANRRIQSARDKEGRRRTHLGRVKRGGGGDAAAAAEAT